MSNVFDGEYFWNRKKKKKNPKLSNVVDEAADKKNSESGAGKKDNLNDGNEDKKREIELQDKLREERERERKEKEREKKETEEQQKKLQKLEEELKKKTQLDEAKTSVKLKDAEIQADSDDEYLRDSKKPKKRWSEVMKPVTLHVHVHENGEVETTFEEESQPSPTQIQPTNKNPQVYPNKSQSNNSLFKFNRKLNDVVEGVIESTNKSQVGAEGTKHVPHLVRSSTVASDLSGNPYKNKYTIVESSQSSEAETLSESDLSSIATPKPKKKSARPKSRVNPTTIRRTQTFSESEVPKLKTKTKSNKVTPVRKISSQYPAAIPDPVTTPDPDTVYDWEKRINGPKKYDWSFLNKPNKKNGNNNGRNLRKMSAPPSFAPKPEREVENVLPAPEIPMQNKKTSLLGYEYSVPG